MKEGTHLRPLVPHKKCHVMIEKENWHVKEVGRVLTLHCGVYAIAMSQYEISKTQIQIE